MSTRTQVTEVRVTAVARTVPVGPFATLRSEPVSAVIAIAEGEEPEEIVRRIQATLLAVQRETDEHMLRILDGIGAGQDAVMNHAVVANEFIQKRGNSR